MFTYRITQHSYMYRNRLIKVFPSRKPIREDGNSILNKQISSFLRQNTAIDLHRTPASNQQVLSKLKTTDLATTSNPTLPVE